jgi:hypothetical protein
LPSGLYSFWQVFEADIFGLVGQLGKSDCTWCIDPWVVFN